MTISTALPIKDFKPYEALPYPRHPRLGMRLRPTSLALKQKRSTMSKRSQPRVMTGSQTYGDSVTRSSLNVQAKMMSMAQ